MRTVLLRVALAAALFPGCRAADVLPAGFPADLPREALPPDIDPARLRFEPLFASDSLSGWVVVNGADSTWAVRDGVVTCTGEPHGVLRSPRMYGDFVLDLEWRHLRPGGNAGIFVWSDALPAPGVPFTRSIELQVLDGVETEHYTSQGDVFAIHGARMTPDRPHPAGWERSLPSEARARPSPEWNRYVLTARDGTLQLAVNGRIVAGGSRIAPSIGYLCLESEGSPVEFRNVRLAELPGRPERDEAPRERARSADGFVTLFDGLSLSGWKPWPRGSVSVGNGADAGAWQARGNRLLCDGSGADLATQERFGDFDLSVDWRRAEGTATAPRIPLDFGADWPLAGLTEAPAGRWNRLVIQRRGARLSAEFADHGLELSGPPESATRRVPLVLSAQGGAIEFMNLYLRRVE